jgi:hypothetical protein
LLVTVRNELREMVLSVPFSGRLRLRVDSGIGSLMLPAEFPWFR